MKSKIIFIVCVIIFFLIKDFNSLSILGILTLMMIVITLISIIIEIYVKGIK